jgi:ABC-2 type transport system ATP-binding protein
MACQHTVILSTHILPEVSMTCEKIVIINSGRIAGEGTPESLVAQLKEGEVLRAAIGGPKDAVGELIRSTEGVLDVSVEGDEQDGVYIITSAPGTDVRDSLARKIVDSGFALRELRGLDMTLEDIFLRLTTEEVNA